MIKFSILLVRKPSLTHEEFIDHHRHHHANLFMSIGVVKETVRRYVQQAKVLADLPGMKPNRYDGITELWFDDMEGLQKCFSDPEYMEKIRPDEASFLDLESCDFLVSEENPVFLGQADG